MGLSASGLLEAFNPRINYRDRVTACLGILRILAVVSAALTMVGGLYALDFWSRILATPGSEGDADLARNLQRTSVYTLGRLAIYGAVFFWISHALRAWMRASPKASTHVTGVAILASAYGGIRILQFFKGFDFWFLPSVENIPWTLLHVAMTALMFSSGVLILIHQGKAGPVPRTT